MNVMLISVKEYATRHKHDSGRVRLLIKQGRIPAIKVGNQWCIEENAPWPIDRRIKSGVYCNWRKKSKVTQEGHCIKIDVSDIFYHNK